MATTIAVSGPVDVAVLLGAACDEEARSDFDCGTVRPQRRKVRLPVGECESRPELSLYRQHTISLLRRYMQTSLQLGRLPALIGREIFRAKTSSRRPHTFEDSVIFVHDVEGCLRQLDDFSQQLIARIVLQDYSHEQAARLMRVTARTVRRHYPDALDALTEMLLQRELLRV